MDLQLIERPVYESAYINMTFHVILVYFQGTIE